MSDGDRWKLAVLLALIARAGSEDDEAQGDEIAWFSFLLAVYTVLVVLGTLGGQWLLVRLGAVGRVETVRERIEFEMTPRLAAVRGARGILPAPLVRTRTRGTQTNWDGGSSEARESDESHDVVYISKVGDCFHASPTCVGLNRAPSRASRFCPYCRPSRSMKKLYGKGFGREMHSESHLPCSQSSDGAFLKGFRACKWCLG